MQGVRAFLLVAVMVAGVAVNGATFKTDGHFIGPEGHGSVTALAEGPEGSAVVYAAFEDVGVARSNDGGRTFESVKPSRMTSYTVTCIAVHPQNPDKLLAGVLTDYNTYNRRYSLLLKSDDGGQSWNYTRSYLPINDGYQGVYTIEYAPGSPDTVLAGIGTRNSFSIYNNESPMLRSVDGGNSWNFVPLNNFGSFVSDTGVSAIWFDPGTPGRVLAGFRERLGLFESTNYGQSWARLNVAPFAGTNPKPVFDLLHVPGEPARLLAGTSEARTAAESPLYSSTDGGLTWTTATLARSFTTNLLVGAFYRLAYDASQPNVLWAGQQVPEVYRSNEVTSYQLLRSTDLGLTWENVSYPYGRFTLYDSTMQGLVAGSGMEPRLVAGFQGKGIWLSETGNATLTVAEPSLGVANVNTVAAALDRINAGLAGPETFGSPVKLLSVGSNSGWENATGLVTTNSATRLVINPLNPDEMAAVVDQILCRSNDGGETWTSNGLRAVSISGGRPGTAELYISRELELLKSSDFGQTSTSLGSGLGFAVPSKLAAGPQNDRVVVAAMPRVGAEAGGAGVFVSDDGGITFEKRNTGIRLDNIIEPLIWADDDSYVAGAASGFLLKSFDRGVTWDIQRLRIPVSPGSSVVGTYSNISQLQVATAQTSRTLWGLSNGIPVRSLDDGASWQHKVPVPQRAYAYHAHLEVSRTDGRRVWTLGNDQFAKTIDGGDTWTTIPLPVSGQSYEGFAVDEADNNRIWVATYTGLYRTLNGGANWATVSVPTEMSNERYNGVELPPAVSGRVIVATGYGSWVSLNDGATWQKSATSGDEVAQVIAAKSNPSVLYALNYYGYVYRSDNSGQSWSYRGQPPYKQYGWRDTRLAVSATNPDDLLASGYKDTVYKSTDGGQTWVEASPQLRNASVTAVATNPVNANLLLAGASDGIYKSTDSGITWVKKLENTWNYRITDIEANPTNENEYLAATEWGLLYSADAGETWNKFTPDLNASAVNDVEVLVADGEVEVFAATRNAGIWSTLKMEDAGGPAAAADWELYE